MDIAKLRSELVYFETMLSLASKGGSNPDDRIARGIYERLIADTQKKLQCMEAQTSDKTAR